jgi:hypothetical protein
MDKGVAEERAHRPWPDGGGRRHGVHREYTLLSVQGIDGAQPLEARPLEEQGPIEILRRQDVKRGMLRAGKVGQC